MCVFSFTGAHAADARRQRNIRKRRFKHEYEKNPDTLRFRHGCICFAGISFLPQLLRETRKEREAKEERLEVKESQGRTGQTRREWKEAFFY